MPPPWEGEGQEQRRPQCFSVAVEHVRGNMEDFLAEAAVMGLHLGGQAAACALGGGGTGVPRGNMV